MSMGFPRQEYWSGLSFPTPGDLPNQVMNSGLLHCRQILYCLSHQGSPEMQQFIINCEKKIPYTILLTVDINIFYEVLVY